MSTERLLEILLAPRITEKSSTTSGLYVFKVRRDATKPEIKKAVEAHFNVSVKAVRISNVKTKSKRFQQVQGKTKAWKKAYVSMAAGSEIALIEK